VVHLLRLHASERIILQLHQNRQRFCIRFSPPHAGRIDARKRGGGQLKRSCPRSAAEKVRTGQVLESKYIFSKIESCADRDVAGQRNRLVPE